MVYVCPRCHSENVIPLFAKDGIWKCLDCGYVGKVQVVSKDMEFFWKEYKMKKDITSTA